MENPTKRFALTTRQTLGALVIAIFTLSGCITSTSLYDKQVTTSVDLTDGTKRRHLSPLPLLREEWDRLGTTPLLGLSSANNKRYWLDVQYPGAANIKELVISIDGEIRVFENDGLTKRDIVKRIDTYETISSVSFPIGREYIVRMIDGDRVVAKISTLGGEYVQGFFGMKAGGKAFGYPIEKDTCEDDRYTCGAFAKFLQDETK